MAKLTVGFPEEWTAFEERHARFLELFPALEKACKIAFQPLRPRPLADAVVFGLGCVCREDFLEILLLCGNGYGFAAARLKRSMYERAVTVRYIHLHPDQAKRYVDYDAISKGKLARAWLEQFRKTMPSDDVERLQRAIAEAKKLRDDYVIPCEQCGHKRPSPGWGPGVVDMARESVILFPLLGACYYEALMHAHATPHSVDSSMHQETDGRWIFDPEQNQRLYADHALFHAHTMLLDVLAVQRERFNPEGLVEASDAALEAYRSIWKIPPPAEAPTK